MRILANHWYSGLAPLVISDSMYNELQVGELQRDITLLESKINRYQSYIDDCQERIDKLKVEMEKVHKPTAKDTPAG